MFFKTSNYFFVLSVIMFFGGCQKNDNSIDFQVVNEKFEIGKTEFKDGNYSQSFKIFNELIDNLDNNSEEKYEKIILESHSYIGMVYEIIGQPKDAFTAYNDAHILAKKTGDNFFELTSLNNIAYLEKNPDEILKILETSRLELEDTLNLGIVQIKYHLATIYAEKGKKEEALELYNSMLLLPSYNDDFKFQAEYHEGIGLVHKYEKEFDKALKEFDIALNLLLNNNAVKVVINEILLEKAETLILQGDYDAAKTCLDSLKIYAETSGDLPIKKRINECYLDVYEATNEPINGFTVIKDLREIDNELYEQSVGVKGYVLNKLEHNTFKQEIGFQKARFNYLIIFMLLSSLIFYLYHKFYKKKKEVEILEQEQKVKDEVGKRKALENKLELESINAFMNGQEEERKRFASQLHDGLGANLSAINMHLSTIKKDVPQIKYEKVAGMLKDAINETRSIAHSIMPPVLQNQGLIVAITEKAFEWNCEELEINVDSTDEYVKLDDKLEITLYRGIQECINNIIKYANASLVNIIFDVIQENSLVIKIADNGVGFDVSSLETDGGLGINGLKSRVKYFGGSFNIESERNNGTTVVIKVPIEAHMKQVG